MVGDSSPQGANDTRKLRHRTRGGRALAAAVWVGVLSLFGGLAAACGSDGSTSTTPSAGGAGGTAGNAGAAGTSGASGAVQDASADDAKPDAPLTDASTDSDASSGCVPKTCAQLKANCGSAPDGCGGKIECGSCPSGQMCGGGGVNMCGGTPCSPKTCAQVGASCGYASDQCGTALDCGGCTPPSVCGAQGKVNECGCVAKTCTQLGATCGSVPDGCGGKIDCGTCPSGQTCGGAGPNQCGASSCTPKTCAQLGASCGLASDECSKAIPCGDCQAPDTCGGNGKANECGCTPKSCSQLQASCGTIDDGCKQVDCGKCGTGETCGGGGAANQCGCACSLANADTACSGGTCSIAKCHSGWGDCDSDSSNGCEMDLTSTLEHCGQCGNGCVFANGSASCVGSVCKLGACNADFANCDNDETNGCEANLNADPNNCAACGTKCTAPNGTPDCKAGVCGVSLCNPGKGDCDGNLGNGCETDLATSSEHCKYCGNACSLENAQPACVQSECKVGQCASGFGNCDANDTNGCETDTNVSVTNCGVCGKTCPKPANSVAACDTGTCAYNCNSGYSDCDADATNGCEIFVAGDVANCGYCGVPCTMSHATPKCEGAKCLIAVCAAGWDDCDSNPANGCEINRLTDPSHCGSCANDCHVPNATVGCSSGQCQLLACGQGFMNCDKVFGNGCEVNALTDPANCGACGKVCNSDNGSPTCASGNCGINCNAGYANCNGGLTDGCEIDTMSNAQHCGGCDKVCSSANGTPSCVAGACKIQCAQGFADCNNDVADGCEVNLQTNVGNCSACGNACNLLNSNEACVAGVCQVASCIAPFLNCDNNSATGCEINGNTNVANCGLCGKVCNLPNSAETCVGGVCGIAACEGAFRNCDNVATNGCEIDTNTNVNNCGLCGKVCDLVNASSETCAAGVCQVATCSAPWGNCDGNHANGCETNTNTTVSHCGVCGNACNLPNASSESCSAGACQVASCTAPWSNCDGSHPNGCETNTSSDVQHCGGCNNACNLPNANEVCVNSACEVASCVAGYHDQDGLDPNGCECVLDTIPDTCQAVVATTTIAVDTSTSLPSATGQYTITPSGTDNDWFKITFTTASLCSFSPRITLTDLSGTGLLRMQVQGSACGGAGIACGATNSAQAAGITDWQFNYASPGCYDQSTTADPSPYSGPFLTIPTTVYVRVFTSNTATQSCLPYRLVVSS